MGLEILPWVSSPAYQRWSQNQAHPSRHGTLSGGPHVFAAAPPYPHRLNIAHIQPGDFQQIVALIDAHALPHFTLYDDLERLVAAVSATPRAFQLIHLKQYLAFRQRLNLAPRLADIESDLGV